MLFKRQLLFLCMSVFSKRDTVKYPSWNIAIIFTITGNYSKNIINIKYDENKLMNYCSFRKFYVQTLQYMHSDNLKSLS